MEQYCFLNGSIVPVKDAKVGVYDIGILRGYGVYDGIPVYGGKAFRLPDHLARFRRSAGALKLVPPATDDEIGRAISDLVAKNGLGHAVVRLVLTGGDAIGGIEFDPGKPTFFILVEPWPKLPGELYENGGALITHEHLRFMPEYKTTHYITAALLQEKRKAAGAIEILYVHEGSVLEASTSNFFAVVGGSLVTAKEGVLGGITRNVVLEIADRTGIPAEVRGFRTAELEAAEEAFITSSFKEIVPIVTVDGRRVGSGRPGGTTRRLMEAFRLEVAAGSTGALQF